MNISKQEVIRRGLAGELFPPRSTRHFFPFRKNNRIDLPLDSFIIGSLLHNILHNSNNKIYYKAIFAE